MIRIGIVDDHPAMIVGASTIINLQPGMHVAAAAPTVDALIAQETQLDLVLLDLALADQTTPARNLRILGEMAIPVLAYTSGERASLVQQAVKSGAVGIIRKSEAPETLLAAIRAAIAGETVATVEWAAALEEDSQLSRAQLTPREAEVLALYASGATAEAVAAELFIARNTVIDHIRNIRAKYVALGRDVGSKTELYKRAIEDGLMS
ncbi:MAG TPA: response regulator transcription factor [Arachnia sp.]|nr:response regulator transcription factor [Arachnia sp.]HMR12140.1 response regulator transcription factor [Arachnia sp.]